MEENTVRLFLNYVNRTKRVDLSFYRENFLLRRLQARFYACGVKNLWEYIHLLNKNESEWTNFLDNLGINVSEFYRDPDMFHLFQKLCLPKLFEAFPERTIKCWSCGCAYGEEPYSLAILFKDFLNLKNNARKVQIIATDIDEKALERAKRAEYDPRSLKNVSEKNLKQNFVQLSPGKFRVKDEIQRMVVFKKFNVLQGDLPQKIDVLFFRNVTIYFSQDKAEAIFARITNPLRQGGYLILGKVEHLPSSLGSAFTSLDLVQRIYIKT